MEADIGKADIPLQQAELPLYGCQQPFLRVADANQVFPLRMPLHGRRGCVRLYSDIRSRALPPLLRLLLQMAQQRLKHFTIRTSVCLLPGRLRFADHIPALPRRQAILLFEALDKAVGAFEPVFQRDLRDPLLSVQQVSVCAAQTDSGQIFRECHLQIPLKIAGQAVGRQEICLRHTADGQLFPIIGIDILQDRAELLHQPAVCAQIGIFPALPEMLQQDIHK